jgi:hypothetical protein
MSFDISTFKAGGLQQGGARPALFDVQLTFPAGVALDATTSPRLQLTCRASQLPAATVGSIDVGYFGRMIKVAGDRTFTDWNITVMNDEDFVVRAAFEKWSNSINNLQSNIRDINVSLESYKAEAIITQYGKTGFKIRQYRMVGAFPTAVDAIDLNWETQNQVETFGVTFAYDYWLPELEFKNSYRAVT